MSKNLKKKQEEFSIQDYAVNILIKGLIFGLLAGGAHLITYRLTLTKLLSQNNL